MNWIQANWIGLVELAVWVLFCFWAVEKLAPWLNDWLVSGINERDEARKENDTP